MPSPSPVDGMRMGGGGAFGAGVAGLGGPRPPVAVPIRHPAVRRVHAPALVPDHACAGRSRHWRTLAQLGGPPAVYEEDQEHRPRRFRGGRHHGGPGARHQRAPRGRRRRGARPRRRVVSGAAFSVLAIPWLELGLIDREQRLTALGQWIAPRRTGSGLGRALRRRRRVRPSARDPANGRPTAHRSRAPRPDPLPPPRQRPAPPVARCRTA